MDAIPRGGEPAAQLVTVGVGSGKTTAAEAMGDLLGEQGVPHAVIDLEWLSRSWPMPAGAPFKRLSGSRTSHR